MNYFLLEQFLFDQKKTRKTVDGYLFAIRKFIDLNPNYEQYEFKDISAYFADLNSKYTREDGRVTATVNGVFYAVKLLYLYLVKTGIRNEIPFPTSYSIKGTRTRGLNTKKLFTPDELDYLINFVRNEQLRYKKLELRNQVVVSLLVYQALQSDEILFLNVSDVDLDNGRIYIASTASTNERTLSLHPTQYILFHDYIHEARKRLMRGYEEYLDLYPKLVIGARAMTEQVGGIGTLLRKYRLLFPHREMTASAIRQSVIYKWLNVDKRSLETVQTWAGHKWPSTTERYISKIDMDDQEEINGFHPMELL